MELEEAKQNSSYLRDGNTGGETWDRNDSFLTTPLDRCLD